MALMLRASLFKDCLWLVSSPDPASGIDAAALTMHTVAYNGWEGDHQCPGGTACSRHRWSGGTGYPSTDGPGGPFIPDMDGPGGPITEGTVSSMTD